MDGLKGDKRAEKRMLSRSSSFVPDGGSLFTVETPEDNSRK